MTESRQDKSAAATTLPPVFVLTLPAAHKRRAQIAGQLDNLKISFEFVDGIYGKNLTPDELEKCYDREKNLANGRPLSLPEIGCALGHLEVYKRIVKQNLPFALVLEDDALLSADTPEILQKLKTTLRPEENTIVLLSHVKYYEAKNILPFDEKRRLVFPYRKRNFALAHGYVITQNTAQLLLEKMFPIWNVSDDWGNFRQRFNIKFLALLPYAIAAAIQEEDSFIEDERRLSFSEERANRKRTIAFLLYDFFYNRLFHRLIIMPLQSKKQPEKWTH